MDERFLHYIWKFQKFNKTELKTTTDQPVVVLNQGNHNHNSGPDFEEARIKIDVLEWAGNVEIHIDSSDWKKHHHQKDPAYDNVILHVVWENTISVLIGSEPIPTIELKTLVDQSQLSAYQSFLNQNKEIFCDTQLSSINTLSFTNMLDRMMAERLEEKASAIQSLLKENNNDWEAVTYLSLASNFGFSLNKEPFLTLANSLPFPILSKYHNQSKQTDALIFGQAGFLDDETDTYQCELRSEFEYLKNKHKLVTKLKRSSWKFGRMRPSNFPSLRLAQFSSLICHHKHLFSKLTESENSKEFISLFHVHNSEYWTNHYDFGKEGKLRSESLGRSSRENILVNTIAPLLAAYSVYISDQKFMERALTLLETLKPESNTIIKKWQKAGRQPKSAFDSQALIGLFKNYCSRKRCLECSIGIEILGK